MKRIITTLVLGICIVSLTSSLPVGKVDNVITTEVATKSNEVPQTMTLEQVVKMSTKDFAELKGSKITFKERLVLKFTQKQLKREIRKGNLSKDQEINVKKYVDNEMPKFNVWGFVLGFFLGLIGVGLAHIFSNSKSFRRSSWYGLGAWIILLLILSVL